MILSTAKKSKFSKVYLLRNLPCRMNIELTFEKFCQRGADLKTVVEYATATVQVFPFHFFAWCSCHLTHVRMYSFFLYLFTRWCSMPLLLYRFFPFSFWYCDFCQLTHIRMYGSLFMYTRWFSMPLLMYRFVPFSFCSWDLFDLTHVHMCRSLFMYTWWSSMITIFPPFSPFLFWSGII